MQGSGSNIIRENIGRKKDAIGEAKTLLVSHIEMLEHHEHYIEHWESALVVIDKVEPQFTCTILDNSILIYSIEYMVEEYAVPDH